jgi:cell division protein FtsL
MKSLGNVHWFFLLVLLVGILVLVFSLPVWNQNRFAHLHKEQKLLKDELELKKSIYLDSKLEYKILGSRERIGEIAEKILGLQIVNRTILVELREVNP